MAFWLEIIIQWKGYQSESKSNFIIKIAYPFILEGTMRKNRQLREVNKRSKLIKPPLLYNQIPSFYNNSPDLPTYSFPTYKFAQQHSLSKSVLPVTLSPIKDRRARDFSYDKWSLCKAKNSSWIPSQGLYSLSSHPTDQFDDLKIKMNSFLKNLHVPVGKDEVKSNKHSILKTSEKEQIFIRYSQQRRRRSPTSMKKTHRRFQLRQKQVQREGEIRENVLVSGWEQGSSS